MDDALAQTLLDLKRRDLETRNDLLKRGRLFGRYDAAMQQVHKDNAEALARIVELHGWPGVSKVGLEGSRAAWLVAQHAICTPDLQRGFLRALEQAAEAGDVPDKQVAFLTDRIRFHEGRPQVYGTVLDWDADGELGCELEDPDRVDERRAAVGLEPFQLALERHRQEVANEGGRPPADYATYRAAAERWATEVGWR